jgi:hypothetical protein
VKCNVVCGVYGCVNCVILHHMSLFLYVNFGLAPVFDS